MGDADRQGAVLSLGRGHEDLVARKPAGGGWLAVVAGGCLLATAGCGGRGAGDAGLATTRHPRVLLVTLDTLHVEFTSVHNPAVSFTPNLAELARQGVLVREARTPVPMTLPSHLSLFSGRSPVELGVLTNTDRVPPEVETLAERLHGLGYRTAAFTSLAVLGREQGLDQGFDHYDDGMEDTSPRWYRRAPEMLAGVASWLRENADVPVFLWVHLSDPHEPYQAPGAPPDARLLLDGEVRADVNLDSRELQRVRLDIAPGRHRLEWRSLRTPRPDERGTQLQLRLSNRPTLEPLIVAAASPPGGWIPLAQPFWIDVANPTVGTLSLDVEFEGRLHWPPLSEVLEQYSLEVGLADRTLGELRRAIAALPGGERTLWIVVSDHGEGLYRQGVIGHAEYVFEDQLRILWLMAGPGLPAGRAIEEPGILMEDVAPTVLDILGVRRLAEADGRSLAGCWRGGDCPGRRRWWGYGVDEGQRRPTGVAAYELPFKCLWQVKPRSGCFELGSDAWETRNLATGYTRSPETQPPEVVRAAADIELLREALSQALVADTAPDREALDALRSLGYVDE